MEPATENSEDPVPIEPNPAGDRRFTPTEIAQDWGTSRAYASKKIREGCPTHSLEAAREWRLKNSVRGVGFRSKRKETSESGNAPPVPGLGVEGGDAQSEAEGGRGIEAPIVEVPAAQKQAESQPETEPPPPHESLRKDISVLDSIEQSLAAAINVEKQCNQMVVEAQNATGTKEEIESAHARLPVLISAYTKALDNRLSAEERVQKLRERYGVLITADFAKQLIRKAWIPHITRLRSIAKRVAPKANPTDDIVAEEVIAAEIEDAIRETREPFEKG